MAENEISQEVFEMLRQLAQAVLADALHWERQIRNGVLKNAIKDPKWAPRNKNAYEDIVALRDQDGNIAAKIDVSDPSVAEIKAQDYTQVPFSDELLEEAREQSINQVITDTVETPDVETTEELSPRLQAYHQYLADPRFQRLVEQEGLVLTEDGTWITDPSRGNRQYLDAENDFPATQDELMDLVENRGWEWDKTYPKYEPELVDGSDAQHAWLQGREQYQGFDYSDPRFNAETDRLYSVGGNWITVRETDDPDMLPSGTIISESDAREIATENGWQWVDDEHPEIADDGRPVVVAGSEAEIPESVKEVVVSTVSNVTVDEDTRVVVVSEKAEVNETQVTSGWDSFADEVQSDSHAEYAFNSVVLDDQVAETFSADDYFMETEVMNIHETDMG